MTNKLYVIIGTMLLVTTGIFVGKMGGNQTANEVVTVADNRSRYPLLATRIFIDEPNDSLVNFAPLRTQLDSYAEANKIAGSIYFEYLPTGTPIRVGADNQLVAASLMKLPAAMALYSASEKGKVDLDSTIELKKEWLDSAYGELYKKGAGHKLTLREATEIMLTRSDNTALKAVAANIPEADDAIDNPFSSLDVDIIQNPDLTLSISARSYASILKCLYFACYNNKSNSQELLGYLDASRFDNRLAAGVDDKSIAIAHKVGNYTQDTQSDCGIVYVPERNYMLCMMIKTTDTPEGDKILAEISELVYDYVASLPD